jgi:hypothetical protein
VTASDAASAYEDGLMRQEKASALQSRQDWYGAQSEWKAAESHYMTAMRADPNNRQYSNAADLARKSYEWCSVAPYARPPLVQLAGLVFVLIAYYVSLASLFNIPFAGEIQALILKDSWWEGMRTSAVVLAFFPFVARLFGKGSALAFVLTSIGGFYKRRHDAWRGLYAFLVGLFGIYLTTVGIVTHFLK